MLERSLALKLSSAGRTPITLHRGYTKYCDSRPLPVRLHSERTRSLNHCQELVVPEPPLILLSNQKKS